MITLETARSDPRMASIARKQLDAFKDRLNNPHDENVCRRYGWLTAEWWRIFRQCEEEDRRMLASPRREVA